MYLAVSDRLAGMQSTSGQQAALPEIHSLSLYGMAAQARGLMVAPASTWHPFKPSLYSWFKYGRLSCIELFGDLLAEALEPHLRWLSAAGEQVVLTGTPYKELPNAANLLATATEQQLRFAGLPTSFSPIYQHSLVEGDYATLSPAERELRNSSKQRDFDENDFAGKHVVIVDDIWVTGSIIRSTIALLQAVPTLSITVANVVRMDQALATTRAHAESELNQFAVRGLMDLGRLIGNRDDFVLTTRAVKYILEAKEQAVSELLARLGSRDIQALFHGAVADGYNQMPRYQKTFRLLSDAYPS